MDRFEAAFQRAYDRYKAERRSLILTCFLVVIIDFASFKITGGNYLGLQGTLSWDVVNNLITVMLIWFACMHSQASYHYWGAAYPEPRNEHQTSRIDNYSKYISGIKEAYETISFDVLTKAARIVTGPKGSLRNDVAKSVLDTKLGWHKRLWMHIKTITILSIRDHRIAADVVPVIAAIILLLNRFVALI